MTPSRNNALWDRRIGTTRMLSKVAPAALAAAAMIGMTTPSLANADTGTSNGATYTTSTTTIDLGGGWQEIVGQLSGGNPAVATAFNNASMASGRTMAGQLDDAHVFRTDAAFDAKSTVIFRPTAVAQVLTGVYFWQHAAHPLDFVTTIVIDSRTGRPITLDDLFTDTQAGLNILSQQTKVLIPLVYGHGGPPDGDLPGNAPVETNFHNWIPTAKGLEIHFEDYQFAHGLPVITVPWSQLTDVLAPDMKSLAQ